ncbi:hypothetical protein NTE_02134 [Candidatus Nitrososphaera evergladensis SR1]|uniref:Uncharacterized protein n=1 Tax=Candidatus Nitrososphaera evergladensis SR1 TaxID=1459636 RepID=A0A075MY35_9ARCH|nr:hypothetical protein NTE_02134 [Candidatus Nitrososphaera evergladensis SR1]
MWAASSDPPIMLFGIRRGHMYKKNIRLDYSMFLFELIL